MPALSSSFDRSRRRWRRIGQSRLLRRWRQRIGRGRLLRRWQRRIGRSILRRRWHSRRHHWRGWCGRRQTGRPAHGAADDGAGHATDAEQRRGRRGAYAAADSGAAQTAFREIGTWIRRASGKGEEPRTSSNRNRHPHRISFLYSDRETISKWPRASSPRSKPFARCR